jgi:NitT/TauT family transport system permease protein
VGSLVLGLQALPSVCWLPLAILWLGLSEQAIIFVVVMGALFSITLGVDAGVKNTSPIYLKAARNLGSRGLGVYTQVILPSALPAILSGLKQGWSFAWRSLMAGELLYYTLSLGNLLQTGRDLNDAAQVMAVMLLIIILGVSIDSLIFAPIERRVRSRWGLIRS